MKKNSAIYEPLKDPINGGRGVLPVRVTKLADEKSGVADRHLISVFRDGGSPF